jgi:hypothetical protein
MVQLGSYGEIMKNRTLVLSTVLMTTFCLAHADHASARTLDLNNLPGHYEYVPTADTSIACPVSLDVTYDPATQSLDSEIFHFSNIGGKAADLDGGIQQNREHASYSERYTVTKINKNSVRTEVVYEDTTTSMANFVYHNGPMDAIEPGSMASYHMQAFRSVRTTRVTYDVKTGFLKKTSDIDGQTTGDNCAYQKD